MELKRYQKRVLDETRRFLDLLAGQIAKGERYPSQAAWDEFGRIGYRSRKNGLGKDLPSFCIKVPTGGGKTLLATHVLGQIYATLLKRRNGAGLALWIVPSDQIYKDTLKCLRNRRHPYRESIEFAVSRRIEIWEKDEIARLTPGQLRDNLNILIFKLASANRETKDQLKMFQDSGGNIVQHFPPEDDANANRRLKDEVPNLDMIDEGLAKTSLANLIRFCEPPVILDEGHKAYSELAQKTIEGFNASVIVELSATPPSEANTLVKVTGTELLEEEMIKLPINIAVSGEADWKTCLGKAKAKLDDLERQARKLFARGRRHIRPIALVQVERTSREQKGSGFIHAEDAQSHLIERLGVPAADIRIKTSEEDGLEDIDLLDEGCTVRWIITKAALQEGWDCPFAYLLVTLNPTQSKLSMTQLVGRVLRQPDTRKTKIQDLDESWVFCLRKKSSEVLEEIRTALTQEGYEGDHSSIVDRTGGEEPEAAPTFRFRKEFRRLYQKFDGRVYLPRFCVKSGKGHEGLDYFRHLISQVDVGRFDYASIDWNLADEMKKAEETFYRLTLGQQDLTTVGRRELDEWESDERAASWLVANLGFDHFSFRQLRMIVDGVLGRLRTLHGKLGLLKFILKEKIAGFVERETDRQTHAAFLELHRSKRLCFYLHCVECKFEIPPEISLRATRRLVHANNEPIGRSLFDAIPESSMDEYEKDLALYIDGHEEVLWWYRNLVGEDQFRIQGYRRDWIYPDFVIQKGSKGPPLKPEPTVIVVEGKGSHLVGNEDTEYKRDVAAWFEKVGRAVPWQELGKGFENSTFRFQIVEQGKHEEWKDELKKILEE